MSATNLTFNQVLDIQPGLMALSKLSSNADVKKEFGKEELFEKIIYPTTRYLSKTKSMIEEFNEERKLLLQTLGEEIYMDAGKNKDGKNMPEPSGRYSLGENKDAFENQLKEITENKENLVINNIRKFAVSDLKKLCVDVEVLMSLEPLIDFDDDTEVIESSEVLEVVE